MERIPIRIVFEDEYLIVIEKREGLLSVGTSRGREEITAHRLLNNYLQNTWDARGARGRGTKMPQNMHGMHGRGYSAAPRAFIVHRLDRETSGLMVFAKSEEVKLRMQENWDSMVTHRGYVAVVNGKPGGWSNSSGRQGGPANGRSNCSGEPEEGTEVQGTIRSWLKENSAFVVYSSPRNNGGQLAITHYKVLDNNNKRRKSLIELELETGRKNQIRVHMQELGCPIYGDKKYFGENPAQLAESKKARRLYLHAHILDFIHPVTGKEIKFTTGIPRAFREEVQSHFTSSRQLPY